MLYQLLYQFCILDCLYCAAGLGLEEILQNWGVPCINWDLQAPADAMYSMAQCPLGFFQGQCGCSRNAHFCSLCHCHLLLLLARLRWPNTMVVACSLPSPLAPGANSKFWDSFFRDARLGLCPVGASRRATSTLRAQRVLTVWAWVFPLLSWFLFFLPFSISLCLTLLFLLPGHSLIFEDRLEGQQSQNRSKSVISSHISSSCWTSGDLACALASGWSLKWVVGPTAAWIRSVCVTAVVLGMWWRILCSSWVFGKRT